MTETFDICILGGGPAGATAALMLKKRAPETSILLIESSNYEQWRVGETLSPDAGRAFRELGIWDAFNNQGHLASYGTCSAWEQAYITENEFIYHAEGKGWHLNRVKFDQWMAEQAAEKGAILRKQTRYISHERNEQGLLLSLQDENQKYQVQTGMVIDASGRMSAFGRNEKVERTTYDRLSGAIGFFSTPSSPSSPYSTMTALSRTVSYCLALSLPPPLSFFLHPTRLLLSSLRQSDENTNRRQTNYQRTTLWLNRS